MSCRRTARIVAATLDGRPLGDADRRHVAGCRHCTAALERLPDFEASLGQAVGSIVREAEAVDIPEVAPPLAPAGRPPAFPWLMPSLVAVVALVALAGGAVLLLNRPVEGPGQTTAGLPVEESQALTALGDLDFACRESVLDPTASPPRQGQNCQRITSGFQQGLGVEQLTVDLYRGETEGEAGVTRATVTLRQLQFEGSQGPPTASPTPIPMPAPLEPEAAMAQLTAVAEALFGPEHEAEVATVLREMVDAEGTACGCERSTSVGLVRVDGDTFAGYTVSIAAPGVPLPPPSPSASASLEG